MASLRHLYNKKHELAKAVDANIAAEIPGLGGTPVTDKPKNKSKKKHK